MAKDWLHRISYEWDVSRRLLDEGYLSIGWARVANSGIQNVSTDGSDMKDFNSLLEKYKYPKDRSRWSLWRFCRFQKGDRVVVPLFDGKFSVYRVVEPAKSISELPACLADFKSTAGERILLGNDRLLHRGKESAEPVDLGLIVRVERITKEDLSRYDYADSALTARMKIRQTNAEISDLRESIDNAIKAGEKKRPVKLYAESVNNLAKVLLDAIMRHSSPEKFERLVKWYFQKIGASQVFIPPKKPADKLDEADADVIAEFDALMTTFYIQVKMHDGETSDWGVTQISKYYEQHGRYMDGYTAIPWVISSGTGFSKEAVALAQEKGVRLIDGAEFARMLVDVGIQNIDQAFDQPETSKLEH